MIESRRYLRSDVIAFRQTKEKFGGLSNMASGYPIRISGISIRTAEALYQACRFPHLPEVQQIIFDQSSPMTAKMRSKPYRDVSRDDWLRVRVPIMKWCLRAKLIQNWDSFGCLLLRTGSKAIVEDSRKDSFWGAKPEGDLVLEGQNVLGRLLMELREILRSNPDKLQLVQPVPIADFTILGVSVPVLRRIDQSVVFSAELERRSARL